MTRRGRVAIGVGLVAAALACTAAVLARHMASFGMSAEAKAAFFARAQWPPTEGEVLSDGRRVHWVAAGDRGAPLVVLVHGSPGSWDNFAALLDDPRLLSRADVAAIDRPGFGRSGRGLAEPSLILQARAVAAVVKALGGGRPAVLVGHSLGGPIAARAAMDHPALVAGLVLVAPSLDPDLERVRWFQKVATWPLLDWLVPTDLATCNRELLPLADELRIMHPLWGRIRCPVWVIQGEDDALVPAANAAFAERVLTGARVEVERVPGLGHLIPWQRPDLIRSAVLALLPNLAASPRS